jgi:hypothetical protein
MKLPTVRKAYDASVPHPVLHKARQYFIVFQNPATKTRQWKTTGTIRTEAETRLAAFTKTLGAAQVGLVRSDHRACPDPP